MTASARFPRVQIVIRDATQHDAPAIAEIYRYHVVNGTASYEVVPPSVAEIAAKMRFVVASGWPFLVAQVEDGIAGFAYVTQFRDRDAYRYTAEDSIYVDQDRLGRGVGRALLSALLERSSQAGFRTMVAVIGGAEPASIGLHSSLGFRLAGRLERVGYKFERWLDSVYMQAELSRPGE